MNTDKITTWLGAIGAALLAGQEAISGFSGGKVDWVKVAVAVVLAAIGYFTNKPKK